MLSEWKENIESINEYKSKIEECKHILKDLIEQTDEKNKNIQLNKKKLETLNQKKKKLVKVFFQLKMKLTILEINWKVFKIKQMR